MLAALRVLRLSVPVALLANLAASATRAAEKAAGQPIGESSRRYAVHIAHDVTAGLLAELLDGARERLTEPRCQRVLDDFAGADGRPLRDRLAETGRAPEDYLGLVVFYDGRKHPRCGQKGILAVANAGSRVVWVCPEQMYARARSNPVWAEATLIHEALHTLGLGENPPTSTEITSRILARCQ